MATFHESYDLLLTPTVADVAPTLKQFIPTDQMVNRLLHSQEIINVGTTTVNLGHVRG